jgi:hypothetical protein
MSEISIRSCEETDEALDWSTWRRWVAANAFGELIGLGGAALVGFLAFTKIEALYGPIVMALIMILAGTFLEGVVVGAAQWAVLRQAILQLRWPGWIGATAVGAFAAWLLGMVPSTMMAMTETQETTATTQPEISNLVVFGLAALMGLVLGSILALPQWWVLRRYVEHAFWWILANSFAWMVGMVLVFVGASMIPEEGITTIVFLGLLTSLLLAGISVGAIHGLALIQLLKQRRNTWI